MLETCGIVYKCDWGNRGRIFVPMAHIDNKDSLTNSRFDTLNDMAWMYLYIRYHRFITLSELLSKMRTTSIRNHLVALLENQQMSPKAKEESFIGLVFF